MISNMEPTNVPASEDALGDSHYIEYLAAVNLGREVTATEDIFNNKGALITRQGARLDHLTAQRIAKHKLAKPLEYQIQIEGAITAAALADHFTTLAQQHPDLAQLHQAAGFEQDFCDLLAREPLGEVIAQKLTVLQLQQPELFDQALFGIWFAMLVGRTLGLPKHEIHMAGIAALIRDLGFLHMPHILVSKGGKFTPDEWRTVQGHAVVGQIIAKDVAILHPLIARAVLEHHERNDGTGYPAGKEGAQLCLLGQIVSITDKLGSIRLKIFNTSGRNLRDTEPSLLMNGSACQREVYDAVCALLRMSGLERTAINPCSDHATLLSRLKARTVQMHAAMPILARLDMLTQTASPQPTLIKLRRIILQTHNLLLSSGLVSAEILAWLDSLVIDAALQENIFLCEMELLQNELEWHLRRLSHTYDAFLLQTIEFARRPEAGELNAQLHCLLKAG